MNDIDTIQVIRKHIKKEIDSVDLKILRILQDEGRISNLDLSKKIEMSPPPTLRRVRDLEDNGYIDGFRANLDPSKLGYDLVAWIFVSLKNQNELVYQLLDDTVIV